MQRTEAVSDVIRWLHHTEPQSRRRPVINLIFAMCCMAVYKTTRALLPLPRISFVLVSDGSKILNFRPIAMRGSGGFGRSNPHITHKLPCTQSLGKQTVWVNHETWWLAGGVNLTLAEGHSPRCPENVALLWCHSAFYLVHSWYCSPLGFLLSWVRSLEWLLSPSWLWQKS